MPSIIGTFLCDPEDLNSGSHAYVAITIYQVALPSGLIKILPKEL